MFPLTPRAEPLFDLFERQAAHITESAQRLGEMVLDFSNAPAKSAAIKELEHAGHLLTHDLVRKINTTFVTPFHREDVCSLGHA